jgi:uncharacterized protein
MQLQPRQWRRGRLLRRAGKVIVCVIVLWFCASLYCAYHLTRRARAPFAEPPPKVAWGLIEPLHLSTCDGQSIGGWFVAGPQKGPSVLLLHGNGDSRTKSLALGRFFALEGCSVLMLSLRAHGDSTGDLNDIGYSARHDVVAAVDYLERRRSRPILIQGMSLGAAAAIFAGQSLGTRVHGYVLEEVYRDLRTAVSNRVEKYLPIPLDRIAYAGLALAGPLVLPDLDDISPVNAIGTIPTSTPVVLMAGRRDRDARPAEAEALYQRVKSHANLVWFERAAHESLYVQDPALYKEAVSALIAAAAKH